MRRLLGHIKALPPDSALARHLAGERVGWTTATELEARAVDALRRLEFYIATALGGNPDAPERTPRPGENVEPAVVSLPEFARILEG